jgi:carbon storage regulator
VAGRPKPLTGQGKGPPDFHSLGYRINREVSAGFRGGRAFSKPAAGRTKRWRHVRPTIGRRVLSITGRCAILVLSRLKDEVIVIGNDIRITIVEVRGDKVRVGISAPREIPVHRQEVYEAIQRDLAATDSDCD